MKRILAILLCAVLCAALLPACGSGKNETLTVWCAEMDKEMVTSMVEAFLATKPAVKGIEVEICEDSNTRERIEESPAAAADVFCIPHDQLGALVAGGQILEITGEKHIGGISQNTAPSISAGKIGGKQYGFPSSFETHMLFYDKSLISDSAARTLEGIMSSGVPEDGYHFAMNFGDAYFSADWFFTYGCKLFGENGEDRDFCDFDSSAGVAAMTYIIENSGSFGNINDERAIELFKEHKLGAFIGGPWNAASVTSALMANYGCAALPSADGREMRSFAGFKLYCVNANTKNSGVALDLAAWLTNTANQKTRFQTRNLIPVATELADDADVAASTTAKAIMAQGPHAIAMPSIPEMSNFWTPTGTFTSSCYSGEISPADLPAKLSALAGEILGTA